EGMVQLGAYSAQRRADRGHAVHLGEVFVALGQVAAVASQLDEQVLAPRDVVRALEVLDAGMALDAIRPHLLAPPERLLDELDVLEMAVGVVEVAVRDLRAVHPRALAAVAGRTTELLGWVLAEEELTLGVRLPRVRLVVEANLVDAGVAGRAAVDARD